MAGEDADYLERVAALPCCAANLTRCQGPIQAHHPICGRVAQPVTKGGDRRAHDHRAIPLCMLHHANFHACTGPFKILIKSERAAWEGEQEFRTQRILRPVTAVLR